MDIRTFLAHAVKLEAAAAQGSDSLADAMETWGNREVAAFFRKMAEFSRLHLKQAMERAGFRHVSQLPEDGFAWPRGVPPESAAWFGVDGLTGIQHAVELALEAERCGLAFYSSIATMKSDPRVRLMAAEFAEEEQGHVATGAHVPGNAPLIELPRRASRSASPQVVRDFAREWTDAWNSHDVVRLSGTRDALARHLDFLSR